MCRTQVKLSATRMGPRLHEGFDRYQRIAVFKSQVVAVRLRSAPAARIGHGAIGESANPSGKALEDSLKLRVHRFRRP
jgi:hypothetical protein